MYRARETLQNRKPLTSALYLRCTLSKTNKPQLLLSLVLFRKGKTLAIASFKARPTAFLSFGSFDASLGTAFSTETFEIAKLASVLRTKSVALHSHLHSDNVDSMLFGGALLAALLSASVALVDADNTVKPIHAHVAAVKPHPTHHKATHPVSANAKRPSASCARAQAVLQVKMTAHSPVLHSSVRAHTCAACTDAASN